VAPATLISAAVAHQEPRVEKTLKTPARDPVLEVRGLTKRYGPLVAVDELSLAVDYGTILALLGPNGAGKTTTLEVCEGFRHADGGTVRVLGLDPARQLSALRPRIGVMLQEGGLHPGIRCGEMLRLAAATAAHPLDARMLLRRLGLDAVERLPCRRLSGGQQQRLSLAMAIVGRPELVFLDEPTSGLDPQARHEVWSLIGDLKSDGVTVVLTTHYMEEAERLADDIIIIDRGRVVGSGPPRELTRVGDRRQLHLTAQTTLDVRALAAAFPGLTVTERAPGAYVLVGDVGPDQLAALTSWLAVRRVPINGLRFHQRTLEDVFLELTGRSLRS
jgi:ABC-2 type transport system ATP-binding protein